MFKLNQRQVFTAVKLDLLLHTKYYIPGIAVVPVIAVVITASVG